MGSEWFVLWLKRQPRDEQDGHLIAFDFCETRADKVEAWAENCAESYKNGLPLVDIVGGE